MIRLAPLACALVVWLQAAGAGAFPGCAAAASYGANTTGFFVSAAFAKVARGEATVAEAHAALDRMLAAYVVRGSWNDEERLCLYEGMWRGLVDQLSVVYGRAGLACLERTTLATHARALLGSVLRALDDGTLLDADGAARVFSHRREGASGAPLCEPPPLEACTDILAGTLPPPPDDVIAQVAVLVCADAAQPDAGVPDGG